MHVSSRTVLVFLLAMLFANSTPTAFAKRGGRRPGGEGGRPGGNGPQQGGNFQGSQDFQRPPKDGDFQRPQGGNGPRPQGGNGPRPQGGNGPRPRGPPGVGVFSVSSERPIQLGSIAKSRGATIAPINGLTAIYEGKLNDTSTPAARRALLHDGVPEDMVLLSSTSQDGTTWSPGALLTIENLPTGLIARNPTISADGSLLFFVGATGDLKSTPSAIHVASCSGLDKCTYRGVAFEQPGKIISGCAYAQGILIVPYAGDMVVDAPSTDPTPVARKLLDDKMPGSQDHKELAGQAWIATCTQAGTCTSDGNLITIPAPDADAKGRGPSAWRGSMIFNGQYEFYGSGQGNWPIVSSNGASWKRATAELAVDVPGPDPSCAATNSGLVCAAPMKPGKGGPGKHGNDVQSQPEDLL